MKKNGDCIGSLRYEYRIADHLGNTRAVYADTENDGNADLLQEEAYYPFGMRIPDFSYDFGAEEKYLYNGKELEDRIEGFHFYDYGARFYDAALARWHSVDPLAEEYTSFSAYHYTMNNPIRYIDVFGMGAGDFYDENGKYVGTDGVTDNKIYIVTDKQEAKQIKKTDKSGGTTQRSTVSSSIEKPSQDVMSAANTAVSNTDATGYENGFVVATDGTTSSNQTNNNAGSVELGPGYEELEGQGKQTSFDVHTHPDNVTINPDGTYTADNPNPSGTPGQPGKDYGYRGMKESQGRVAEPSWVIGTNTSVTNNNGTVSTSQKKVVTFYRSTGPVGHISWDKFKKTVNKIP